MLDRLSSDLRPVQVRSLIRSWAALFLGALIAAAGFLLVRLRGHPISAARAGSLLVGSLLILLNAGLVSAFFVSLAFPGRSSQKPLGYLSGLSLFTLFGYYLFTTFVVVAPAVPDEPESICSAAVLALSILPTMLAFGVARRLLPVSPAASALSAGVFSVLLGAGTQAFLCPNNHGAHILVWHLTVPLLVSSLVLYPLGGRLLRR